MQTARVLKALGTIALGGIGFSLPAEAQTANPPPAANGSSAVSADAPPPKYPPCDAEPDEASMQGAQGAFQAGNASFNEADYPRAIFFWEDAYRRDCTAHAMLKNLARAYELNDQFNHAINALETYLERNPESGETEAISRRIENLRRRQEEREAAARRVTPPPPKAEPEPEPAPEATNPLDEEEQFPNYYDDGSSGSERSVVPLVFAGVGLGAGVLGGVMWGIAKQDEAEAEDLCGPGGRGECLPAGVDAGNDALDRQVLWGIVAGAGAAITVGGIIWYFAQPDAEASEAARVVPSFAPGFAGLEVSGAF